MENKQIRWANIILGIVIMIVGLYISRGGCNDPTPEPPAEAPAAPPPGR